MEPRLGPPHVVQAIQLWINALHGGDLTTLAKQAWADRSLSGGRRPSRQSGGSRSCRWLGNGRSRGVLEPRRPEPGRGRSEKDPIPVRAERRSSTAKRATIGQPHREWPCRQAARAGSTSARGAGADEEVAVVSPELYEAHQLPCSHRGRRSVTSLPRSGRSSRRHRARRPAPGAECGA